MNWQLKRHHLRLNEGGVWKVKIIKIWMSVVIMTIALIGCSEKPASDHDGQGYIFEISKGGVLILDNVEDSEFGKKWIDIHESYTGNAIWLSTSASKFKVGQKVRYWVEGGINESFPAQAAAKKIEILKE
jgi:hypothetical protein